MGAFGDKKKLEMREIIGTGRSEIEDSEKQGGNTNNKKSNINSHTEREREREEVGRMRGEGRRNKGLLP